jgi:hypothetical protein
LFRLRSRFVDSLGSSSTSPVSAELYLLACLAAQDADKAAYGVRLPAAALMISVNVLLDRVTQPFCDDGLLIMVDQKAYSGVCGDELLLRI